jgi:hypothetical protein
MTALERGMSKILYTVSLARIAARGRRTQAKMVGSKPRFKRRRIFSVNLG